MAVPQTMLAKRGGRSLKTSNLPGEEWQWAQKASARLGIHIPFHSSVCVCLCVGVSIREACWVSLFKVPK